MKVYDSPDQLVLVLNATEEEEKGFSEETGLKFKSVSHEMAATVRSVEIKCILTLRAFADVELVAVGRQDLYKGGGICSVTSRIVSVDMLMAKIPTELITGIVVLHAEMFVLAPHARRRMLILFMRSQGHPDVAGSFHRQNLSRGKQGLSVVVVAGMLIHIVANRLDSSRPSQTILSTLRSECRLSKLFSLSSKFVLSTSGHGQSALSSHPDSVADGHVDFEMK